MEQQSDRQRNAARLRAISTDYNVGFGDRRFLQEMAQYIEADVSPFFYSERNDSFVFGILIACCAAAMICMVIVMAYFGMR